LVDDPVEEAALDFRQQADSIAAMLVVVWFGKLNWESASRRMTLAGGMDEQE